MRFHKLDLNLLVALDALFTEANVSRAADRLCMSQSSLSSALARLRDYFNDELLVQVGRKMELTPRALVLKDAVKDLLLRLETTITAQPEFDSQTSTRTFALLMSDYISVILMPHVLALARQEAPHVRFDIRPLAGVSPHLALERGEADLLMVARSYCSSDHPVERVYQDTWQCIVWAQHPTLCDGITRAQYLAADHLVVNPVANTSALDTELMRAAGVTRKEAVHTYSFTAQPSMVVGTNLVATVHGRIAQEAARTLPIRCFAMPLALPPIEVVMQWHKYLDLDPGLNWLRSVIRRASVHLLPAPGGEPPAAPHDLSDGRLSDAWAARVAPAP